MTSLTIHGGHKLQGFLEISGAKNAVLPLLAGALLGGCSRFEHVPDLADVVIMCEILEALGTKVERNGDSLTVDAAQFEGRLAPYELVSQMRASMLVMGPLLARYGHADVALPGGCAIGARPIDLHLKGFAALGAEVNLNHGLVQLRAKELRGASIYLDFPSVGATENIIMAACLAKGVTIIENTATEPEIGDLITYLNRCGAKITQAGTSTIQIEGVPELYGANHRVIGDRIEAGTYLMAAAMTGGSCCLRGVQPAHLQTVIAKLSEMGCRLHCSDNSIELYSPEGPLNAAHITTLPYPGFPTDLQAPMLALLTLASGHSIITETVFENRFLHAKELIRMGAKISLNGRQAFVQGAERLYGAQVRAADLRGGAALILAALAAEGETRVHNFRHLQRGYENMPEKLQQLGAVCHLSDEEVAAYELSPKRREGTFAIQESDKAMFVSKSEGDNPAI